MAFRCGVPPESERRAQSWPENEDRVALLTGVHADPGPQEAADVRSRSPRQGGPRHHQGHSDVPRARKATVSRRPESRPHPACDGQTDQNAANRRPAPTPSAIGKGTWRQARFTGAAGTRAYRVYIPQGLRRTTRAPLLLALHGCGQNALDFAAGTRFNDLADKHKFVVVYPEQSMTHNGQRCWNWFRTGHQFRAQGEPAILAGIVRRVIQETAHWRIDPERVYVTGISAGGAMAVVLAATYPELFAAVGVHSAPPYRSASSPANALAAMQGLGSAPPMEADATDAMPPMIIFQGTLDSTVRSVNAQRIADQWLAYYDHSVSGARFERTGRSVEVQTGQDEPGAADLGPQSPRIHRQPLVCGRQKVLELWIVDGLGHAWSGGSPKVAYSDPRDRGPPPRCGSSSLRTVRGGRRLDPRGLTLQASSRRSAVAISGSPDRRRRQGDFRSTSRSIADARSACCVRSDSICAVIAASMPVRVSASKGVAVDCLALSVSS